ncbi:unnamed protein product [Schistosoma margrebowiei]|uniref:Uncharacterized protein n=1 Tax=Schistosoma margrebowiei TaxID=48269 RepID=A0AA85AJ68_9TREM|nr:unnamed protein product [Schistosoma margrebowiei]
MNILNLFLSLFIIMLITWSIFYVISPNTTTQWIDDPLVKNSPSDILNLKLFDFKCFLYEIPCEWNIQLSEGSDVQRCPVSWLTYAELKKRNYTTIVKQPKLIHSNHLTKPDDIIANYTPTEYIDQSDVILKRKLICN